MTNEDFFKKKFTTQKEEEDARLAGIKNAMYGIKYIIILKMIFRFCRNASLFF